ncbi:L,D-transpeptidase [Actinokineospora sp.]|uniref:L,D-transpeptidase n=1 Tax=Actinokineospora sp. TaxID=1872133 RepID=UPI00403811F6
MQVKRVALGAAVAVAALLSACSTGTAAPQAQVNTTTTTTSSAAPTTTMTVAPTTTTTTVAPTTTKPPVTTTKPKPKPTSKPAPKPAQGAPCSATADACIDLSANQSWLLADGKVIYGPVPITHGRAGYRTPPGTFRVSFKNIDHKSSIFNNAPMPYSVFFNGGIAFHEGSLRQTSHGCIHLSNAAAKMFYNKLRVGSVVQVVR